MTRKDFLQTLAGGTALASIAWGNPQTETAAAKAGKIKRGVTLYSYQEEYYARTMTLERCIGEASDIGAYGIELIPTEMMEDYPNPSSQWLDTWHGWMSKYGTTPVCSDVFIEMDLYQGRSLSELEALSMLRKDIDLAKRMGFGMIRGVIHTPLNVVERALPYAEKNGIKLTVEIHAPIPLDGEYVQQCQELIARTTSPYFGYTIDLSLFVKRPVGVIRDRAIRDGIPEEIVHYIDEARVSGVPREEAQAKADSMGYRDVDSGYGTYLTRVYETPMQSLSLLEPLMPHVYHVHAKFWEMDENMQEASVPYAEIVPLFQRAGYNGYFCSEYEGQRFTQDISDTDSCEQVRRHQLMLRKLLHEV